MARLALRRAHVSETTGLQLDCDSDAGVRDWREHGDFQHRQCRAAATVALSGLTSPRADLRKFHAAGIEPDSRVGAGISGLPRPQPVFREICLAMGRHQ